MPIVKKSNTGFVAQALQGASSISNVRNMGSESSCVRSLSLDT